MLEMLCLCYYSKYRCSRVPGMSDAENKSLSYVALGFISISTKRNGAPLHETHDPLKLALVNDAAVVITGLWAVSVKLLQ